MPHYLRSWRRAGTPADDCFCGRLHGDQHPRRPDQLADGPGGAGSASSDREKAATSMPWRSITCRLLTTAGIQDFAIFRLSACDPAAIKSSKVAGLIGKRRDLRTRRLRAGGFFARRELMERRAITGRPRGWARHAPSQILDAELPPAGRAYTAPQGRPGRARSVLLRRFCRIS